MIMHKIKQRINEENTFAIPISRSRLLFSSEYNRKLAMEPSHFNSYIDSNQFLGRILFPPFRSY
jgi:hypothetical protein